MEKTIKAPDFDNDLAQDNVENDLPDPDKTDIRRLAKADKTYIAHKT